MPLAGLMIIAMMATGLYLILATFWRRQAKQKMEHLRNGTQHSLAQAGLMIFGMNAQGKYTKLTSTPGKSWKTHPEIFPKFQFSGS